MGYSIYVAVPLMALLLVLQTSLLPYFPILGIVPQLLFLVAIAWGLLHGVNEGLLWAFVAGLFMDLFSLSPVGVSAIAYMTAVPLIVWIGTLLPQNRYIIPMIQTALATFIAMMVNFLLLRLFGLPVGWDYLELVPSTAILHSALVLPIYWVMYRIDLLRRPRAVEL